MLQNLVHNEQKITTKVIFYQGLQAQQQIDMTISNQNQGHGYGNMTKTMCNKTKPFGNVKTL